MNLNNDQLAQCRADFEVEMRLAGYNDFGYNINNWVTKANAGYIDKELDLAWIGFQAAWRPRMVVDKVLLISIMQTAWNRECHNPTAQIEFLAEALYRAMGGKDGE